MKPCLGRERDSGYLRYELEIYNPSAPERPRHAAHRTYLSRISTHSVGVIYALGVGKKGRNPCSISMRAQFRTVRLTVVALSVRPVTSRDHRTWVLHEYFRCNVVDTTGDCVDRGRTQGLRRRKLANIWTAGVMTHQYGG